jgi:hypothetical protein
MKFFILLLLLLTTACQQSFYMAPGSKPFGYFSTSNKSLLTERVVINSKPIATLPPGKSFCTGVNTPPNPALIEVILQDEALTVVKDTTFSWTVNLYAQFNVVVNADSTISVTIEAGKACL